MAKKAKPKASESTMVSFRADPDLHLRLKQYAANQDRKLADAVRRLVIKGLTQEAAVGR